MTVRIGKVLFDGWVSLELPGGWSDTFVFQMSSTAGLPPADYAQVVRSLIPSMLKLRRSASLWVRVSDELDDRSWFVRAVRYALLGSSAPVAVTDGSVQPQIRDFSFYPWMDFCQLPPPPSAEPYLKGKQLSSTELSCLRVLARADCAYTAEVASLSGFSQTTVRKALRTLAGNGFVQRVGEERCPLWKIRRPGLSTALRSWGLPPGHAFPSRKERGRSACKERESPKRKKQRSSTGRHRRTARLWPAWVRRAYPQVEVRSGWTEVSCGRTRPDGLCWGRLDGCETLFWLEVESGNTSRKILRNETLRRVNQALVYARSFRVRLVFALLGPPWVCEEVVKVFRDLPDDLAVVIEDWKVRGDLPIPAWGRVAWV